MSETQLRSAIVEALNATGMVHVWRVHAGGVKVRGGWMNLCPTGTPDVCGYTLRGGRFVGIEIKVPKGKTMKTRAAAQLAAQSHIAAHGGISGQVESVSEAISLVASALARRP